MLSLALAVLPLQNAFAAPMLMKMKPADAMQADSAHCQDAAMHAQSAPDNRFTAVSDINTHCCCDQQCDSGCQPDCSSHGVSALPLTLLNADASPASHAYADPVAPAFHNTFTPLSPPPLA